MDFMMDFTWFWWVLMATHSGWPWRILADHSGLHLVTFPDRRRRCRARPSLHRRHRSGGAKISGPGRFQFMIHMHGTTCYNPVIIYGSFMDHLWIIMIIMDNLVIWIIMIIPAAWWFRWSRWFRWDGKIGFQRFAMLSFVSTWTQHGGVVLIVVQACCQILQKVFIASFRLLPHHIGLGWAILGRLEEFWIVLVMGTTTNWSNQE